MSDLWDDMIRKTIAEHIKREAQRLVNEAITIRPTVQRDGFAATLEDIHSLPETPEP